VSRLTPSRGASDAQITAHLAVVDRTVLRWRTQLQTPPASGVSGCMGEGTKAAVAGADQRPDLHPTARLSQLNGAWREES